MKNETVVLPERRRCCVEGGCRLLPLGVMRCAWLGDASKATFFFFFRSDSDHIEPFVSGQFDVYIEGLLSITVGQGCRFWTNILTTAATVFH